MSIIAYTGLPRSGKSYGVIENVIEPAIKKGREVWTNIPVNEEAWMERHGKAPVNFDVQEIKDNPRWFHDVFPAGAVLVLDECWRVWPAGLKANNADENHQEFLTMHGHMVGDEGYTTEVVLVTQDLSQLASFVRALVDFTYRSVKLRKLGMDKTFRVDVYEGAVTGQNPPLKKRMSDQVYRYKNATFDLYVSHTMSKAGAGIEQNLDKRSSMFSRRKAVWLAVFILPALVFIYWGSGTLMSAYGMGDDVTDSAPAQQALPSTPTDSKVRPAGPPPAPRFSDPLKQYDVYIIWSNGGNGSYDYEFTMETRKEFAQVALSDLQAMNYTIKPVNHCLVLLSINGGTRPVTCRQPDKPQQTLIPVGDVST
ncbi:MAG TPA: hypothetical protein EYG20_10050 [Alcanivorax sp.]|nr:hypothetical protein [Alcanivorax sp.]